MKQPFNYRGRRKMRRGGQYPVASLGGVDDRGGRYPGLIESAAAAAAGERVLFAPWTASSLPATVTSRLLGIMKIAISIAVVLVALSVAADPTEAPRGEASLSEKFGRFQQDVQDFLHRVNEKTVAAFHDLHNSEISTKTRNWFTENFQKLKDKFKGLSEGESR